MMWRIVVDEPGDDTCMQVTVVLFSILVTGLISNVDISGTCPSVEVLMKVNIEEFIVNGDTSEVEPKDETVLVKVSLPVVIASWYKVIFHLRKLSVVVHVTSSWPPLHTDAISEGDIVTTPTFVSSFLNNG